MTAIHTLIPAGFAEVTIVLQLSGDPEPCSFSFGVDGVTTAGDLSAACVATNAAFTNAGGPLGSLSSSYTFVKSDGRTDPAGSNLTAEEMSGLPGDGGADAIPSNCSVLVRKNTALGGRANRGRFYVPGILAPDQIDQNGMILAVPLASLQGVWDQFYDDMDTAGFPLVILHASEVRNPALPAPAMIPNPNPTPTPITGLRVDPRIATQRRRMR